MMVRVEVSSLGLVIKYILPARVNDWLSQAFGKAGFPIIAWITMRQIGDEKSGQTNLDSQPIINQTSRLTFIQALQSKAGRSHRRHEIITKTLIEVGVPERHGHEGYAARCVTPLNLGEATPSVHRKLHGGDERLGRLPKILDDLDVCVHQILSLRLGTHIGKTRIINRAGRRYRPGRGINV